VPRELKDRKKKTKKKTIQWVWPCNIPYGMQIKEKICVTGLLLGTKGRAVAQRLDAGFPQRRPGFAYGQHVGFVVDKAALGQVFSEYFGFPC
jgi:hypothetical protein